MRFESYRSQFVARVNDRLELGAHDAAAVARHNLGGSGALTNSVRVVSAGDGTWRIGSDHPGAMVQERGAVIRPRAKRALKFKDGRYSRRARIPAKRWLSRAGKQLPALLSRRLRGG